MKRLLIVPMLLMLVSSVFAELSPSERKEGIRVGVETMFKYLQSEGNVITNYGQAFVDGELSNQIRVQIQHIEVHNGNGVEIMGCVSVVRLDRQLNRWFTQTSCGY